MDFCFDQQSAGEMPGTLRNLKFLIFFADCSIIDARSVFYIPRCSVVSYVLRKVCVLVVRHKFFNQSFRYFATFLFWSTNRRESQIIQESKTFWIFFVDHSITDAKLFFVNSFIVTWCIQKGVNLYYWSDKQFFSYLTTFFSDQQSEKILKVNF